MLLNFGLDVPLDCTLVTFVVSHSCPCFIDLILGNAIIITPRKVPFDLVIYRLSEKITFVYFEQGEQGF